MKDIARCKKTLYHKNRKGTENIYEIFSQGENYDYYIENEKIWIKDNQSCKRGYKIRNKNSKHFIKEHFLLL